MKIDPSIYCISAHNPLASVLTSGDVTRTYRCDHFISKGTLIPVKLVDEIIKDFVIYEETSLESGKSALVSTVYTISVPLKSVSTLDYVLEIDAHISFGEMY